MKQSTRHAPVTSTEYLFLEMGTDLLRSQNRSGGNARKFGS
ncbi:MAG: hypothetical protein ACYT04_39555 [Nostoc sp.]